MLPGSRSVGSKGFEVKVEVRSFELLDADRDGTSLGRS